VRRTIYGRTPKTFLLGGKGLLIKAEEKGEDAKKSIGKPQVAVRQNPGRAKIKKRRDQGEGGVRHIFGGWKEGNRERRE